MSIPTLEDTYDLGPELGRGGFGVVYRATPRAGGDPVAVKVATTVLAGQVKDRVFREVRLASRITHPAITRLHGLFQDREGRLALVYELVEGEPLTDVLAAGPVSTRRALAWVRTLGGALDFMHGEGLVHRDVKPANIMVEPRGEVKLLDFGLLRSEDAGDTVTSTGIILGTAGFVAPEVLRGAAATRASDLYALACVAYQLFTGVTPFAGALEEIQRAQLTAAPTPPSARIAELPAALDAAIARGMDRDPARRPASCRELADALAIACGRRPAPAADRGRGPVVAGLVVAGLAAGAWLGDPGTPSPVPAPPPADARAAAPATGPLAPGFARRLRQELTDAAGWLVDSAGEIVEGGDGGVAVLDHDPARYGVLLRHLAGLREFHAWMRDGGRPEELPPELVEELREVDERYAAEGLPRPFRPYLSTRPLVPGLEVPWSDLARSMVHAGETPPLPSETAGGWVAAVDRATNEYRDLDWTMEQELRANPVGPFPGGLSFTYVQASFGNVTGSNFDFLRSASKKRFGRVAVLGWIEPLQEAAEAKVYATARALRADPAAAPFVACYFLTGIRRLRAGFWRRAATMPLEDLLLGEPRTAPERLVAAGLADAMSDAASALGLARGSLDRAQVRHLEDLLAAPGEGAAARFLRIQALGRLLSFHADRGSAVPMARAYRELAALLGPRSHARTPHMLYDLARGCDRLGSWEPLTRDEVDAVLAELGRRHRPGRTSPADLYRKRLAELPRPGG